jgi:hypothetical protein
LKNDPNTLPILKTYAQGADDWGVQFAAVRELARGWKNDSDTLPILQLALKLLTVGVFDE